MSNKYKIAVLFGAAHGINDFIAGYLLANLSVHSTNWQLNTMAFLGYSLLAFGGQLPAGLLVDKFKQIKKLSLFALALLILSISVSGFSVITAIVISGIASAFIHVCGGAACFVSDNKSNTLAGIFTSPGVIGLILGGIVGALQFDYFYVFIIPLVLLFFWLLKMQLSDYTFIEQQKQDSLLETHDFFMLILLFAIAMRSMFWNLLHMMCFDNNQWLIGLGAAAAIGKLAGGFLADKLYWKNWVLFSIIGAVVLLNAGKNSFPVFCMGVALLQSAVPVTLVLMQNYLQKSPATAAGLSLGITILLAGIPTYFEQFRIAQQQISFIVLLSIVFLVSNFWFIRNSKKTLV